MNGRIRMLKQDSNVNNLLDFSLWHHVVSALNIRDDDVKLSDSTICMNLIVTETNHNDRYKV